MLSLKRKRRSHLRATNEHVLSNCARGLPLEKHTSYDTRCARLTGARRCSSKASSL